MRETPCPGSGTPPTHVFLPEKMAARFTLPAGEGGDGDDVVDFPPTTLSADAAPFTPHAADAMADPRAHFSRCAAKLRALRGDAARLQEELNSQFDQLISENYYNTPEGGVRPEVRANMLLL